jgi:hypothetical protein
VTTGRETGSDETPTETDTKIKAEPDIERFRKSGKKRNRFNERRRRNVGAFRRRVVRRRVRFDGVGMQPRPGRGRRPTSVGLNPGGNAVTFFSLRPPTPNKRANMLVFGKPFLPWVVSGSAKANGREPKTCLHQVFNYKLGSFEVEHVLICLGPVL